MACNGYIRGNSTNRMKECRPTTNTYAHCGDGLGAPCRNIYNTATQEKSDMENLNNRFACFLEKIKGLNQGPAVDTSQYREVVRMVENEMSKLKNDYERELDRLRKALDDCCKEKNSLAISMKTCGSDLAEFQTKIRDLEAQLQQALSENQALRNQLASKDKDIADLKCHLKSYQDQVDMIKPDYMRLKQDADNCKKRLDSEIKAKADEGCRIQALLDKSAFDNNNKDKQIADLQDRLKATNDIIASLEGKIRQLTNSDGSQLASLLTKIRDGTAAEIRRQQQATEEALNKSLQTLKCHIETDARDKDGLMRENAQLKDAIQQMQSKNSDLEGRLTAACTENQQLKVDLERDRKCAQQEVCNLEQKLRELHTQMMGKIKECNQARDQQLSLNAEIGNYKTLLDAMDTKTSQSQASVCPPAPVRNTKFPTISEPTVRQSYQMQSSSFNCSPMRPADVLASVEPSRGGCSSRWVPGGVCDSKGMSTRRQTTQLSANYPPGSGSGYARDIQSACGRA